MIEIFGRDTLGRDGLQHLVRDQAMTLFRVMARCPEWKQGHRVTLSFEGLKDIDDRDPEVSRGRQNLLALAFRGALIVGAWEPLVVARPIREINEV
jgi:hypothetical protein